MGINKAWDNESRIKSYLKAKGITWDGNYVTFFTEGIYNFDKPGMTSISKNQINVSVFMKEMMVVSISNLDDTYCFCEFSAKFQDFDFDSNTKVLTISGLGNGMKPSYSVVLK